MSFVACSHCLLVLMTDFKLCNIKSSIWCFGGTFGFLHLISDSAPLQNGNFSPYWPLHLAFASSFLSVRHQSDDWFFIVSKKLLKGSWSPQWDKPFCTVLWAHDRETLTVLNTCHWKTSEKPDLHNLMFQPDLVDLGSVRKQLDQRRV